MYQSKKKEILWAVKNLTCNNFFPIPVVKNNNSEMYKWHLFITTFSTKIWQIICAAFLYFIFPSNFNIDEIFV